MSATPEQKRRLLRAKIAVALQDELGRVPKEEEINQAFLLTRVMYKAVLGLHFKRKEQKKQGQLRSSSFLTDAYAYRLRQSFHDRPDP